MLGCTTCIHLRAGRCCPAPLNAEILLVSERGSCPQPVVLKHSHRPASARSSSKRTFWWRDGGKGRAIPSALVALHWTGVRVQGPGSRRNGEGDFAVCAVSPWEKQFVFKRHNSGRLFIFLFSYILASTFFPSRWERAREGEREGK